MLTIDGVRVGEALGRYAFQEALEKGRKAGDGSCMIVLATDAPLSSRNLERLAKRAVLGLARTGSFMGNGSGDFVIAFSTKNRVPYDPAQPPCAAWRSSRTTRWTRSFWRPSKASRRPSTTR